MAAPMTAPERLLNPSSSFFALASLPGLSAPSALSVCENHSRSLRFRRRLFRVADQRPKLAQGTGLKEDGELKVHLKGLLDFGNEADADERMAAEREEVVVGIDVIDAEQILPHRGQSCLDAFAAGTWRGRDGG